MRTTINIDDQLLQEALRLTGIHKKTQVIQEALTELVARESAKRLAAMGGAEPNLRSIPRRRVS